MPLINTLNILRGLDLGTVSPTFTPEANIVKYTNLNEKKALYDQYVIPPEKWTGDGMIPESDLKNLVEIGYKNLYLKTEAADSLIKMWEKLKEDCNKVDVKPKISSTYRSYQKQYDFLDIELFIKKGGKPFNKPKTPASKYKKGSNGRTAVAWPGESPHGKGIAMDIGSIGAKNSMYVRSWMKVYGLNYDWSWYNGKAADENWHFVYIGNSTDKNKREKFDGRINRETRKYYYDTEFSAEKFIKEFKK
tara:strand:- start:966 stop:1709 length:744 start_codon:yes stop_codon:yes gene_type:complete